MEKLKKRKQEILDILKLEQNENIINLDTSYIISSGRKSDMDLFTQINIYKANNLVSQAGDNYLINFAQLAPKPLQILPQYRNRLHNIYFETPHTNAFTIRFFIPKGYTVQGLENLNMNIENSVGSFVSKATIVNNVLVLNCTKQINVTQASKTDWNKVLEIMDASNTIAESKIVLKKL